ncbi:MAG: valine--tRNA ligase [Clostridia bacterium]|nr:valine--tRNA ligase [Clostridia bacterium]
MEMNKNYNPKDFEQRIYKEWEEKKYFEAHPNDKKLPYTIVMPPPNITGQLHIGHALNQTLQDAIIRFKRMQGYETLWLPGTDHASIATEVKIVEKILAEEGKTKQDLGREEFLRRAWDWKNAYGNRICEQIKRLGSSCDWSKLSFTMDDRCSKAVIEVFVKLYEKGLIYRGSRIINWCPCCKTALSDAEVEYSDEESFFWHLRYKVKDSDEYIVVATTRPETMLGDTAVAVNPKDKRYTNLIGKTVILPLLNKEIPIVADFYVDMSFGTGAVKITPAHDPNDFEVGLRHNLPAVRVMYDDGTMNELAGKYNGLDRYDARKAIVNDLQACGALVKIEPHAHNVGHCYRCHSTVEPIISKQWFVKMESLAKPAIKVVKDKSIKFTPKRFTKIYYNWMENIKDWCISRQLWWGHRIPAYYCEECGELVVSRTTPEKCPKCNCVHFKQDEDVLDTWFSSALWPFSTLGYPEKTKELEYFYPTDTLITGYDIIFFWVARMVFSGLEHMDKIPFKDVMIHGIVRDAEGRKMSKSLGNGIDPLEVIDTYGADTLRFSLINGVSAGNDTRYSPDKVEGTRNFINKLWNASRFVLMNAEDVKIKDISECKLAVADKWIISKLNDTIKAVTLNMDKFEIGLAATTAHDFLWYDFCDWYIELSKPALYSEDLQLKTDTLSVLVYVLSQSLKLLHPIIPFITEEIYQNIPSTSGSIMTSEFPKYNKKFAYRKDRNDAETIMSIIKGLRNLRAQVNAPMSKKMDVYMVTSNQKLISRTSHYVEKLAGVTKITFVEEKSKINEKVLSVMLPGFEIYVPLGDLVDVEQELARLKGELAKVEKDIAFAQGRLNNPGFASKAPAQLVEAEKAKLAKNLEVKEKLLLSIQEYQN